MRLSKLALTGGFVAAVICAAIATILGVVFYNIAERTRNPWIAIAALSIVAFSFRSLLSKKKPALPEKYNLIPQTSGKALR